MDQPAGLLDRYAEALDVYQALSAYRQVGGGDVGDWIKLHPREWAIVERVNKLRGESPARPAGR